MTNFRILIFLLISLYMQAAIASEGLNSDCEEKLLTPQNKILLSELQKLKKATLDTKDRASILLLNKSLTEKINEFAKLVGMDSKEVEKVLMNPIESKNKNSTIPLAQSELNELLQDLPERIKEWTLTKLIDDPQLKEVLKLVRLILNGTTSVEGLFNERKPYENIVELKAFLLVIESWSNASADPHSGEVLIYYLFLPNDPYVAKLWVLNGGNPQEALAFAPSFSKHEKIVKTLIEEGADPLHEDSNSFVKGSVVYPMYSLLYNAEAYLDLSFVKYLISLGADLISPRTHVPLSPIRYVLTQPEVEKGYKVEAPQEVLRYLLETFLERKKTDLNNANLNIAINDILIKYAFTAAVEDNVSDFDFAVKNGFIELISEEEAKNFFIKIISKNKRTKIAKYFKENKLKGSNVWFPGLRGRL